MRTPLLVGVSLALAAVPIVHADEVREALDHAIGAYETDVAVIEAQVDQDLGELLNNYADTVPASLVSLAEGAICQTPTLGF